MKAQASLVTKKSNIQYLTNFTGSSGFVLKTKKTIYLLTDFRYIERAKNTIKRGVKVVDISAWKTKQALQEGWQKLLRKHKIKVLGIDERDLKVESFKHFKKMSNSKDYKVKFVNVAGELETVREVKTKKEIQLITKSQRINEKVFKEIAKIIRSRAKVTEIAMAWKIKELGYKFGAEDVSFDPIVAFGKNSSMPHYNPGNIKLKKSDIVLIDMGMKYQGYCSDMTRMILPAKPTSKELEIYNLVLEAQLAAIKNIKAGITGAEADAFSRDIIKAAGYGEQYGHAGGHGVGLDIHEQPALSSKYKKKLKAKSIITVEPGIYLSGKFGVRIEDMILVEKSGNKNLTKVKKSVK